VTADVRKGWTHPLSGMQGSDGAPTMFMQDEASIQQTCMAQTI
jgi:hypothetical protein